MPFANLSAFLTATTLAILAASGKDWQISSSASERTPVYGSAANARKASDHLKNASLALPLVVYAIKYFPSDNDVFDYPRDGYRRTQISADIRSGVAHHQYAYMTAADEAKALVLSCALTMFTTELVKQYTGRERPDGSDNLSFPSGHTISAAWGSYSAAKMMRGMDIPPQYEIPARGALTLLTLSTAWGRVEGKKHYPGDVLTATLLGIALTESSFAFFGDGNRAQSPKFDICITNNRGVTSTGVAATVEF